MTPIMKPFTLSLLATALVLTSFQAAFAQTQPKKASPMGQATKLPTALAPQAASAATPPEPAPPLPQLSFSPVFFRPTESVLAYSLNEPQKVYAWLETQIADVPGKPDQFSTSEERRRYEVALTDKMKAVGPIVFFGACQKKYDSDRQSFEVKVLLASFKDSLLKTPNPEALSLRRLTVAQANVQRDTYSAQNTYGAATEVSRTSSDDYVLAFPAGPAYEPTSVIVPGNSTTTVRLPYRNTFNYLTLSVNLPPTEAREADRQITCMYVFSLEPPYMFKFKERDIPTRDLPFDRTSNGYAFFGRLDQVAVVHKQSGVVYDQAARTK